MLIRKAQTPGVSFTARRAQAPVFTVRRFAEKPAPCRTAPFFLVLFRVQEKGRRKNKSRREWKCLCPPGTQFHAAIVRQQATCPGTLSKPQEDDLTIILPNGGAHDNARQDPVKRQSAKPTRPGTRRARPCGRPRPPIFRGDDPPGRGTVCQTCSPHGRRTDPRNTRSTAPLLGERAPPNPKLGIDAPAQM